MIEFAVNGTLMRGLKLNNNLLNVGAVFDRESSTAPCYRLWSIKDQYPGMLRDLERGKSISVEIWQVPLGGIADILIQEPPGLCVGKIELHDKKVVLGVLAEPFLVAGQKEITIYGGWRNYNQSCHQ
ncbi:MAG: glutamyl-tRNA amidotransferase [Cylindrospermopsis raciborskii KL1]|jgi:hypothetical protein|uniref:allophanate hydrolase-related protein n=1 Tax=Cylindrospermopsis raciborskii TaxID=77022 RepID=UPI001A2672D0|nr:glutamyl-tRNA amidotransferase [Cylindrospermopsis raciborskii]MBG0743232.1 glutamyl-tRNA amidotransferase [Cylindrospermopsis raciborskii KL1]